jgi:hypothetical protein
MAGDAVDREGLLVRGTLIRVGVRIPVAAAHGEGPGGDLDPVDVRQRLASGTGADADAGSGIPQAPEQVPRLQPLPRGQLAALQECGQPAAHTLQHRLVVGLAGGLRRELELQQRLALVGVEGEPVQGLAQGLLAETQGAGDAGLDDGLAIPSRDLPRLLPAGDEQLDRFLVEIGAILRELTPARVQGRHEGHWLPSPVTSTRCLASPRMTTPPRAFAW